jgi:membrane protease YdiL (CAAX protease family)
MTQGIISPSEPVLPWGPKTTFILGALIIFCYLVITMLNLGIGVGFEIAAQGIPESEAQAAAEVITEKLALDGDFNIINYLVCFFIFVPVLWLLARKRKVTTVAAYFSLDKLPKKSHLINYTLALVSYIIFTQVMTNLLGIETPASMVELYQTTDYFVLGFIVLVICAPVLEEMFFRGFLFKGWQASKLGAVGAIILTSLLFTAIHAQQYDASILAFLLIFSFILGFARYRSGSLYLPIYLHLLNNLYSTIELQSLLG